MDVKLLPQELLQKIRHGENYQIEFKEARNELPKSVYETVSAFSNREGGDLFLGVHDCGVITGIEPDAIDRILENFVTTVNNQDKINPALYLVVTEYKFVSDGSYKAVTKDGRRMHEKAGEYHILHISIPMSPTVVRNSNHIFDRNGDADVDITNYSDLVFQCYARKQSTYYVNKVFPHFQASDLRKDLIERARRMAVSKRRLDVGAQHEWADMDDEELLRSANLIVTDENGRRGITLAAILLFGTDNMIGSACAHHKTDCIVRVYNRDRYDDRDVILTNLLESYDRMFAFGQKHLNDSFALDGIQSVSARDAILREIISNSLAHRDYSNAYVAQFLIERNQITVKNGNRAHGMGILNIKSFEPFAKNPPISKVFREIGFADELGSGMRNSYKYTRLYSGAEPEFIEGDVFKIIIPLTNGAMTKVGPENGIETTRDKAEEINERGAEENRRKKTVEKKPPKKTAEKNRRKKTAEKKPPKKTAEKVIEKSLPLKTTQQRRDVLAFMSEGKWLKASEINEVIDVSDRRLREILRDLVSDELIEERGRTKGKEYRIREPIF